jgi:tetratricopeptide (TPR) repeat protein
MQTTSLFLVYLILFRLAIILAGVISIYLGYRLFAKDLRPHGSGGTTEFKAQIATYGFTLKNAAPGTCFALFGIVLVSVMLAQGGPELTLKNLKDSSKAGITAGEMRLRGDENTNLKTLTLEGLYYEKRQDRERAVSAYQAALALMAEPMNNLAWLYLEEGRAKEALPISQMAVQLSPDNANYLDTLAEIYFRSRNITEAITLMEKAAKIDARYSKKLEQFKQSLK